MQYQQQFGSYPPKLGDLAAVGIAARAFICPGDGRGAAPSEVPTDREGLATWINQNTSYTYSGPTLPGGIVAYESAGSHEGGLVNVLMSDGAVERLTAGDRQGRLSAKAAAAVAPARPVFARPTPVSQLDEGGPDVRVPARPGPVAVRREATVEAPGLPAEPAAPGPPLSSLPTIDLPARIAISLAEARKDFKTKLTRQVSTTDPLDQPPPSVFRIVHYEAPPGKLAACLTPDPGDRVKHPAIIWITGGDCNTIGDVWSPAPAANDQTASAYRKAGIVMMFPSLRGGNGNPGYKEGFYGEVDDVLAAADYLAAQPYVDSSRIYLGGHSTGGTLALLVAECSDRFRAVISFGPVSDVAAYGQETVELPIDKRKGREMQLRAPGLWLDAISTATFVFEGEQAPTNKDSLREMAATSISPKVQLFLLKGKSHFSILAPTNQLIADKIKRDTGPATNLAFAPEELPGMTSLRQQAAAPAAGPITMVVTGKPAKEPALRASIDKMAWDLGTDIFDMPGVANYAGKYVEVRGMVDKVETARLGMPHVNIGQNANGRGRFNLACYLATDPLQLDLADDLTPGQEVVICGTFATEPRLLAMDDCTILAVGPDPAVQVPAEQLCKEFATNAKEAQAQYKGRILLVDGTVRQLDGAKNRVVLGGDSTGDGALTVQALVGAEGFAVAKLHAVGQRIRMKAYFSDFRDNQIVIDRARVLRDPSAAGAPTPGLAPAIRPARIVPPATIRPGPEATGARPSRNASAILGTQEGNRGQYGFPAGQRMVGIRYDLTKGAGPSVLRTISAFRSNTTLPIRGTEQIVRGSRWLRGPRPDRRCGQVCQCDSHRLCPHQW